MVWRELLRQGRRNSALPAMALCGGKNKLTRGDSHTKIVFGLGIAAEILFAFSAKRLQRIARPEREAPKRKLAVTPNF